MGTIVPIVGGVDMFYNIDYDDTLNIANHQSVHVWENSTVPKEVG